MLCSPAFSAILGCPKLPFEPSWPAQVAAMAALDDVEYINKTIQICHSGMRKLAEVFNEMDIEMIPSAANFITLIFNNDDEAFLFNENMLNEGIILRHLSGWGLADCVRITVGTEEENEYLIQSLSKVLALV